jgi:hypothetical protein
MNGRSFSSFIPLTSYGFSSRSLLPYCFSKIIFGRTLRVAFAGFFSKRLIYSVYTGKMSTGCTRQISVQMRRAQIADKQSFHIF